MDLYIKQLRKWKIVHHSVNLSYDETTGRKVCFHPNGWEKLTYINSKYMNWKNAIIQLTGSISNIVALDIDGMENDINQELTTMCLDHCKFYNKTRKGYHFIFSYTDEFPSCRGYKYIDDPTNSGFDIKSNRGCLYYGKYNIGTTIIKYENVKDDSIVPMPQALINKLNTILGNGNKKKRIVKNKSSNNIVDNNNVNEIDNVVNNNDNIIIPFPDTTTLDIRTLDLLLSCLKSTHFTSYNEWFIIAFFIKHINPSKKALELFIKYSRTIPEYANTPYSDYETKWNSIKYDPDFDIVGIFYMARTENKIIFNNIKFDHFGIKSQSFIPFSIDSQYLDYDVILPYHLSNKVIAIKSPCGTGKTQFLSRLFNEHYSNKRILFITCRVTLSYSINSSFPKFSHYHNKNISNLSGCDKLIIQIDSLNKLNTINISSFLTKSKNKQIQTYINTQNDSNGVRSNDSISNYYDVIALDECESLLNHISFLDLKAQSIYKTLINLCYNASKIIALDGDYSDRSHHFLSSITKYCVDKVEPFVIENKFRHSPKHFVFTNNRTNYDQMITNDLINGLNIVIISLTQKESEYYNNLYKDKYNTILHNGLQNNKQGLMNINTYWNKARLLIYTSTIEAGVDFNEIWFDKCYIILSDRTVTPRALIQMIYRVRKYKNNTINLFTNGVPFYEFSFPYSFEEIKHTLFASLCDDRGKLSDLNTILCYNKVEEINKHYFIAVFTNILREQGYTYEYRKMENPKNFRVMNNVYDEIYNADNIKDEEEYQMYIDEIRNGIYINDNTRSYGFSIKKYILYKIWDVKCDEMDIDWIRTHYNKTQSLIKYKQFITYISSNSNNIIDHLLNKKMTYIQNILQRFGIRHEDDFKISIECGIVSIERNKYKKSNPNMISSDQYIRIIEELKPIFITKEFRQVFNLPKIKKELGTRATLECIKSIIGEFGFVVNINKKYIHIIENNKRQTVEDYTYYIDLSLSIIDYYNCKLYNFFDNLEINIIEF